MLFRGLFGLTIRTLQKKLNRLHFKVGRGLATGYFGWRTEAAVKRFQQTFGLAVDGIVGPKTQLALRKNGQISPHFHVNEFVSKGNGDLRLDPELVELLEQFRKDVGNKPIRVLSGYRDISYNTKVGGAKRSYHLRGMAADITIEGVSVKRMKKIAVAVGFRGIGTYPAKGFVHVDVRPWPSHWSG